MSRPVLILAIAAFIAAMLVVRYAIAPAIVHAGGLPGTMMALATLWVIAKAIDR